MLLSSAEETLLADKIFMVQLPIAAAVVISSIKVLAAIFDWSRWVLVMLVVLVACMRMSYQAALSALLSRLSIGQA